MKDFNPQRGTGRTTRMLLDAIGKALYIPDYERVYIVAHNRCGKVHIDSLLERILGHTNPLHTKIIVSHLESSDVVCNSPFTVTVRGGKHVFLDHFTCEYLLQDATKLFEEAHKYDL